MDAGPNRYPWLYWVVPALAALAVALPYLLGPNTLLHADSYRAYDWLEAAKFRWHVRDALLSEGALANWNPYLEGGLPALAHPTDGSLNPLFVSHLLFGVLFAMKLDAVLLLMAGAAGVALLGRSWLGLDRGAALVAGLGYALAGWSPSRVAVGFYESLWLGLTPLLLYLLVEATRRGWHGGAGRLAAAVLLLTCAGVQMQLCLAFTGLQLILWALLDRSAGGPRQLLPRVGVLLPAVGLLGAVKFLPMLELVSSRGWRIESRSHGVGLLDGVSGPVLGLFRTADAVGSYNADGVPASNEYEFGGLALLVGILALVGLVRSRAGRPLIGLLLLTAGLGWQPGQGLQLSLFSPLHHVPIFSAMRDTARYVQFFLVLWSCLAAGLGWQEIRKLVPPRRLRIALLILGLLPAAWSSMQLHRTTFRYAPDPRSPVVESFYSLELLESPSAGEVERRLLTWYAPQAGIAVHYRPEDMPPRRAASLQARWEVPVSGPWQRSSEWRGEAWIAEGNGQVREITPGPDRFDLDLALEDAGLVSLNQNFHPDWQVSAPAGASIESRDGLLALRLPNGHTGRVQLRFRSRTLRLGAALSLGSLLLLGGLLWRSRRQTRPAPLDKEN